MKDRSADIVEPASLGVLGGHEVDNVCLGAFLCLHNNSSAYGAQGVTVSSDSNVGLQLESIVKQCSHLNRFNFDCVAPCNSPCAL